MELDRPFPNFAEWRQENLANFCKDAWVQMKQQEEAIEQLRADLRDAMRLVREKRDARPPATC